MKIWGVVGWKNSGKTGLVERLVENFVAQGLRVSTIKHAHHTFDVDQPGKDSFRHRHAGATEVMLSSKNRVALMHEIRNEDERTLDELLARLTPVDLVLIEGFKTEPHSKVEAHRSATGAPLLAADDKTIRAVASDNGQGATDRPIFDLNDTSSISEFILSELELR